jgi:hypothetical protein
VLVACWIAMRLVVEEARITSGVRQIVASRTVPRRGGADYPTSVSRYSRWRLWISR